MFHLSINLVVFVLREKIMKFTVFLLFACLAACYAASYSNVQKWGRTYPMFTMGRERVEKNSSMVQVQKISFTFPKVRNFIAVITYYINSLKFI